MTQDEWDHLLIESFFLRPDYPVWRLYTYLVERSSITLKRTPTSAWMWGMSVCSFVCAHLPKLAEVLWRKGAKDNVEKIARVVSKSSMDTLENSVLRTKQMQDVIMRRDSMRRYHTSQVRLTDKLEEARISYGHDWKTCK